MPFEEVAGNVLEINFRQRRLVMELKEKTLSGKTGKVECFWECNLNARVGDDLYGSFEDVGNYYMIRTPPYVEIAANPKCVVSLLMNKMTAKNFGKAKAVFNALSSEAGGEKRVVAHLTSLAKQWSKNRKENELDTALTLEKGFTGFLDFWFKHTNLRKVLCLGLSEDMIKESLLTPDELHPRLIKNPYTVACVPMDLCKSIVQQVGISLGKEEPIKGLIVRIVYDKMSKSGWACTPISYIERKHGGWRKYEESLKEHYDLVIDEDYQSVYLKVPLRIEEFVCEKIAELVKNDPIDYNTPVTPRDQFRFGDIRCAVTVTPEMAVDQVSAIQGGVDHCFSIITGGAGTGKTTCLSQIVVNLEERGIGYALCSFTGKAVARIKEVSGDGTNAYTIHRLIEKAKKKEGAWIDHLIIDEASMVTTRLFYELFSVYDSIKKITLIGDVNQLQPIGWGSLFSETILSERVPVYRLTTNYRVFIDGDERDGIILNANAIINYVPDEPFEYTPTTNFSVFEGGVDRVLEIINIFAKNGIQAKDVVTLCPYSSKKGDAKLSKISTHYQKVYEKGEIYRKDSFGRNWREGDVCMLTKNDATIGVFNGEMGRVAEIREKDMLVDFGSGIHEFLFEGKMNENDRDSDLYSERTVVGCLEHGYTLTVNKAQGSEWPFVIFYVPYICGGDFVNKKLVYTGLTRAKRSVIIVAEDIKELELSSVKEPGARCENLAKRLRAKLPKMKEYKSKERYENVFMAS